jgi:phosphoglycerate dehydrogenase-like enzyme
MLATQPNRSIVGHRWLAGWPAGRLAELALGLHLVPLVTSLGRMTAPRIAIGPTPARFAREAVSEGGGTVVAIDESPDALVWLDPTDTKCLGHDLGVAPGVRWVQFPFAGIDTVVQSGLLDGDRIWTSAKGAYAEPVAEHALALTLAGLRSLPTRIAARSWGRPAAVSLYDQKVTILGGGGIAETLLEQMRPFRVDATVVRRRPDPVPGASRTVPVSDLHSVLPGSLVVVLALALTPETTGIIGAPELALMDESTWLVNVARGPHVDTDALTAALSAGSIAGAALDVTDPEPLPDGHPLWDLENCIITPHTANTAELSGPLLANRIRSNVRRFAAGEPLIGLVDPVAGY